MQNPPLYQLPEPALNSKQMMQYKKIYLYFEYINGVHIWSKSLLPSSNSLGIAAFQRLIGITSEFTIKKAVCRTARQHR